MNERKRKRDGEWVLFRKDLWQAIRGLESKLIIACSDYPQLQGIIPVLREMDKLRKLYAPWEIKRLRERYATEGSICLPHRKGNCVNIKANSIGLKMSVQAKKELRAKLANRLNSRKFDNKLKLTTIVVQQVEKTL